MPAAKEQSKRSSRVKKSVCDIFFLVHSDFADGKIYKKLA